MLQEYCSKRLCPKIPKIKRKIDTVISRIVRLDTKILNTLESLTNWRNSFTFESGCN